MPNLMFEDTLHPFTIKDKVKIVYYEKYVILSAMLQGYLKSDSINILFADSAGHIIDQLENINPSDRTIVYYDLVYDNINTIVQFEAILNYVIYNNLINVAIVPIPCIEYIAIRAFGKDCELKLIALNFEDYKNTDIYKYSMKKDKPSHEKFCKASLTALIPNKYVGKCDVKNYSITKDEERQLVKELPVIFTKDRNSHKVSVKRVIAEQFSCIINRVADVEYSAKTVNTLKELMIKYLSIIKF